MEKILKINCVLCSGQMRRVIDKDSDEVDGDYITKLFTSNKKIIPRPNNEDSALVFCIDEDTEYLPLAGGVDCDDVYLCVDCSVYQFYCCGHPMILFNITSEEEIEDDKYTDLRKYNIITYKDYGDELYDINNNKINLHTKIKYEYINGSCGGQSFTTFCNTCNRESSWNDK
jgi:hypothetical protein